MSNLGDVTSVNNETLKLYKESDDSMCRILLINLLNKQVKNEPKQQIFKILSFRC